MPPLAIVFIGRNRIIISTVGIDGVYTNQTCVPYTLSVFRPTVYLPVTRDALLRSFDDLVPVNHGRRKHSIGERRLQGGRTGRECRAYGVVSQKKIT